MSFKDYFNFVTDPNRVYLPPLQPKYAFSDHADGRLPNSSYQDLSKASLPKTFITRKGALLLFSEDFAAKSFGRDDDEHGPLKHPMGNLDLKTFGDLAKSILSYGSHGDGDKVHLRFVHDRLAMPRKIRPGFSARRYLSRLTRSFDDSFLDTLTSRGYIQEKTLYQTNSLVPNLRRRINDDLSYLPAPYRIMKSMLVAPGFLSGYNFQRLGTQDSEELSVVLEEEETDSVGHPVHSLGGLQLVEHHGDGATHTVSYSGLNHSEKENVLADLLVKSAINHALEKQKQKLLGDSGSSLSGSVKDLGAERALLSARSTDSETGREQLEFNMAEAVRSYLESQMDDQSVVLDAQTVGSGKKSRSNSQQDSKSSRISVKSVGGSPRGSFQGFPSSTSASIKDSWSAGSHRSTSNAITGGITIPSGRLPLSPITDLDSREPTLNKTPVLPPITTPGTEHDHGTDPHIPKVNVQPPTPQMTSLSLTNKPGLSREPTVQAIPETSGPEDEDENASEEEKEEDSTGWGTTVDEAAILRESEAELEKKAQLEQEETDQQKSQQSLLGHENARRGPVLAGGSHLQSSQDNLTSDIHNTSLTSVQSHPALKGSPLRATGSVKSPSRPNSACSSQSTKDKEKGAKGSVIIGPRGEQIFVGGAVTKDPELVSLQSDSQSVFSEGVRNEEEETTWPLDLSKDTPSERVSPVGYGRKKDFDASSGDFDATLSMTVKRLTSQSDVVEDSPRSTMSGGGDRLTGRASATEQELVQTLTEHAHKIASQVLNQPTTGLDLGTDAKVAAKLWTSTTPANQLSRSQSLQHLSEEAEAVRLLRERSFSAEPSVAEYRQLLKERIGSAVLTTSGEAIPEDAQISDELVVALSQQQLSPADIEVVKDEDGSTVIRPRSSQPSPGDHNSAEMPRAADIKVVKDEDGGTVIRPHSSEPSPGDHDSAELPRGGASDGRQLPSGAGQMTSGPGFDIINYGEAEHQTEEKSELVVRLPEVGEAHPGGDGRKSTVSEKSSQVLSQVSLAVEENVSKENSSKNDKNRQADSSKTNKSLANRSKSSIEDREEFVVGKVEDKKELERLYGPSEKTPPTKEAKEKKPGVSPGKKVKNVKGKKGKKTKKETKVKEAPPSPVKLLTPAPVQGPDGKSSRSSSGKSDSHKSKEESEMSFIIIRDVESSPEPEAKSETKSIRPKLPSSAGTNKIGSEDESYIEETELSSLDEEDEDLASISNKDARAAKRAAQAAKKREAVERKRREHDELLKKKREEAERREQMERELDEEKRRKDEERRLQKLKAEEEQKEKETAEAERKRLAQIEAERERRQREEYARRLEDMRKKQAEEDRLRREREEQERAEEAARKKAEEELLASMAEEERQEYLRRKEQEEENRRLREEQERIYREEQARKAMEEAQQLAEEMARKKAEFERRLAFNRGLQLEASGMDHTQDITRAFVFSYFELLQWLMGGEVPPIERMKGGHL